MALPGWVTDHPGEVADQEQDLVTQLLKLAQLVYQHRVSQMQVRRRGIEAGLDAQRPVPGELFLQFGLDEDFLGTTPDDVQGFLQRHRSVSERTSENAQR